MSAEAVLEKFKKSADNAAPIGGSIKFKLDDVVVLIDGTGDTNVVSSEDKEADTTISTSLETMEKLAKGELNPMMAVMGGKVKISGDMGLAMKLQSLLK